MNKLIGKETLAGGAGLLGLLIVLGALQTSLLQPAEAQTDAKAQAPKFEVDPLWPKPLPNHWVLGQAVGVAADADDHIWIVHRGSGSLAEQEKGLEEGTTELCCAGAPEVLEFDQAGNLLRHWGGPVHGELQTIEERQYAAAYPVRILYRPLEHRAANIHSDRS